eukprot:TRINITY_DN21022_c0_g1_i1.p1 TRINITY_DN21022_c0_g1~~TRINITY_DN21022_c0_g1_i1.p1  ORF type:complete len:284 (-),score=44.03 TRINITY_DN21022_c0_g1_i1:22-873(-)
MTASNPGHRICWALLLLAVFYGLGSVVFMSLERGAELERYAANAKFYEQMQELYSFEHCADPAFQQLSFCREQAKFSESLESYFNHHGWSLKDRRQWTLLGTLFFLTHLATTVGYGSSHPKTPEGQLATIFFALLGIPVMGYALTQVARINLNVGVFVCRKLGARMDTVGAQIFVLWSILVVFLFGGAYVYSWLEPWTYFQSLYFCFVTLSTVGFGDFLPTSPASQAFSILYMIFGLGVCASIIALLTGLVAESHAKADSFVSETATTCRECCGVRGCLIHRW